MQAAVLKGIEAGKLGVSDLSGLRRQTLADHPDKELRAQARQLLASGGSNVDPNRQRLVEAKMQLTGVSRAATKFDHAMRVLGTDRGSSNIWAEKAMAAERGKELDFAACLL